MIQNVNGIRATPSQKKPLVTPFQSTSKDGAGDNARSKKSRYESKILYYLGKVMSPEYQRSFKLDSKEFISNDLYQLYQNEQKPKKKKRGYYNFSKNKTTKPLKKAMYIVNTTIDYGLKNGILAKKGKYYYFTNDKSDFKDRPSGSFGKSKNEKTKKSAHLHSKLPKNKLGDVLNLGNKLATNKTTSLINKNREEENLMKTICARKCVLDSFKIQKEIRDHLDLKNNNLKR